MAFPCVCNVGGLVTFQRTLMQRKHTRVQWGRPYNSARATISRSLYVRGSNSTDRYLVPIKTTGSSLTSALECSAERNKTAI